MIVCEVSSRFFLLKTVFAWIMVSLTSFLLRQSLVNLLPRSCEFLYIFSDLVTDCYLCFGGSFCVTDHYLYFVRTNPQVIYPSHDFIHFLDTLRTSSLAARIVMLSAKRSSCLVSTNLPVTTWAQLSYTIYMINFYKRIIFGSLVQLSCTPTSI